jgi:peptidyl-prolyl cis-trans isomerase SurA
MRGLCLLFLSIITLNCSLIKQDSADDTTIFDIDGSGVTAEEFTYNLNKNISNTDSAITKLDIDEYLELYINFKLKVKEAELLGLDTTDSFIKEFTKYRDQLTESYLKDDSIIIKLVQEAYDRMLYEIDVSHIIIRIQNQNDPIDTLRAYNKITEIQNQLNAGTDFQELAIAFSEDPSVKTNKGNLGYFTTLQMVYPFETAAYNTPVNHYSDPFKTRFGYHILKVNDKRPARGKVQVAHIMLRFKNNSTGKDSIAIKERIFQIYNSLVGGENWENLCRNYSEDSNTKNQGGLLQPFETGRVVPSFSEAAFSLKNPGDISQPVLTPYGWHIIKLVQKFPVKPYPEIKNELTEKVKRDSRSELTHTYLIEKLKKENNFKMDADILEECLALADSSLISGKWSFDSTNVLLTENIFSIQGRKYSVNDLFIYITSNQLKNNNMDPMIYMKQLINSYIEDQLIEYEKSHLEEKYYDYKMLVREYREGILLFDLMDQEVWNKAIIDTTGLEQYFKLNTDKYKWGDRLDAMIFSSKRIDEINMARNLLERLFYPILEDTLFISGSDMEKVMKSGSDQLDSLYNIVIEDSTYFLEVSCNNKIWDQFYNKIKSSDWLLEKFIYREVEGNTSGFNILSNSKKWVEKEINENSALTLQVESGLYEKGDNEIIDLIDWKLGSHDLSIDDIEYLVFIDRVVPAHNKEFDEIRGQVISDYQNFLEQEWIKDLRSKFTVSINNKALLKIYEQYKVN